MGFSENDLHAPAVVVFEGKSWLLLELSLPL
jgi:hypothetical protein